MEPLISIAILHLELPDSEYDRIIKFAKELAREIRIARRDYDALADISILEYAKMVNTRGSFESAVLTRVDTNGNFLSFDGRESL